MGALTALSAGALRTAVVALGLFAAVSAQAETYTARVVTVMDGDTLKVVRAGREVTVRLRWIDAPEKGQPFSDKAKQALSALVAGQFVTLRDYGPDREGRRIAEVGLADGRNLNRELVRLGWAWWVRKGSTDVVFDTLEAEARAARRGLWAGSHPIPPWEWRVSKAHRP